MIFLTVGTTKFPFSRLLKGVDKALVSSETKEKLIAQTRSNIFKFSYQNTEKFSEIPFPKMIFFLSRARTVITHGGAGTILLALKYTKNKPLVVPRSKRLNEHIDDHQIFFTKFLKKKGLIEAIFPGENLVDRIGHYLQFPEKLPSEKKTSDLRRLVEKLIEYTESIK